MSQNSIILKIISLPISIVLICLGIMTILGGHITPGGGFQGGAMIASGVILSVLVYGIGHSPLEFSHAYIEILESVGALGFIVLGLIGLFVGGFFLYNGGTDLLNVVPANIQNVLHYPDVTNAGIIPYLNIFVGLKVFVGLSAIVIAFAGFKKVMEEEE
ncbi:MnhB domain-containing protein [Methanobrevibacter sp.]|uniref:MnhB domain-containing protein n=1 Tax=Methanobrevibacter sp. TaxID=66852 RepID=UPI00388F71DA